MSASTNIVDIAERNLNERFVQNPCRGIVLGLGEREGAVQLSWIMGRSPNSQNRVYVANGHHILKTEPANSSKVEDSSLIIYTAMGSVQGDAFIVSNGQQTDGVARFMADNMNFNFDAFVGALGRYHCEPDAPTFTPRITGYQDRGLPNAVFMSLLRADSAAKRLWLAHVDLAAAKDGVTKDSFKQEGRTDREASDLYNKEIGKRCGLDHNAFPTIRSFFDLPAHRGYGYCLTTYKPGNPQGLDSFEGEPFVVPLWGGLEKNIMPSYWGRLESGWRVALGGRFFSHDDIDVYIAPPINKFHKIGVK